MNDHAKTSIRITELQDEIVQMIAAKASGNWLEIVVNYEIDGEQGVSDSVAFFICDNDGEIVAQDIDFEFEEDDLFTELRVLYGAVQQVWSTLDFRLFSDGEFEFDFSYDPPKRINGIYDEESHLRFANYAANYRRRNS